MGSPADNTGSIWPSSDRGQRQRESSLNKSQHPDLTSLQHTCLDWRALGINMHVGTATGTVLHSDVCRWELRWQCALSKESPTCCVNGAGSGRLAINPVRIEDSNLPLTAAITWSDLWRPANYLSKEKRPRCGITLSLMYLTGENELCPESSFGFSSLTNPVSLKTTLINRRKLYLFTLRSHNKSRKQIYFSVKLTEYYLNLAIAN